MKPPNFRYSPGDILPPLSKSRGAGMSTGAYSQINASRVLSISCASCEEIDLLTGICPKYQWFCSKPIYHSRQSIPDPIKLLLHHKLHCSLRVCDEFRRYPH